MTYYNRLKTVYESIKYSDEALVRLMFIVREGNKFEQSDNRVLRDSLYMRIFLEQIWECELGVYGETKTLDVCDMILEGKYDDAVKELEKTYKDKSYRMMLKLRNVYNVLYIHTNNRYKKYTGIPNIKELHKELMVDLGDSPGEFRTVMVRPHGGNPYIHYKSIENRLKILLEFVKEKFTNDPYEWIKIVTIFFIEFLKIHPFRNGNGRVARILISIMCREFTTVPFSLYTHGSRDEYIKIFPIEPNHNIVKNMDIALEYIVKCLYVNACEVNNEILM